MNFELNMIILLIFRFSAILSLEHCFPHMRRVCITCEKTQMNSLNCVNDLNQEIIVHFAKNDTIDYTSFINTNTKMIQEPEKLTFYSCSPNVTYFQVNTYNFYPINKKMLLPSKNGTPPNLKKSTFLQNCLEIYCLNINSNKLICVGNSLGILDFQFSRIVTPACINNITYLIIFNKFLFEMEATHFFYYALNIEYVKMYLNHTNTFRCNYFENLRNLRFLEIQLDYFNDSILNYDCVFQSNPSLILIRINNEIVWNPCNTSRSSHTTLIVATVTIMIITVVIVIVTVVIAIYYYYYWRFNRNRLTVEIQLNHINNEIINNFPPESV